MQKLLKAILNHEPVLGRTTEHDFGIAYIAIYRTWESYAKTAKSVGLDLSNIRAKSMIDDDEFIARIDLFEKNPFLLLKSVIRQMRYKDRHTLMVIDPLVAWFGIDNNRYHLILSKLIQLNAWCRELDITIVGTHHAAKARTDTGFKRAQDRSLGSGGITGFTSSQMFLTSPAEQDEKSSLHTLTVSTHHIQPFTVFYQQDKTNGTFDEADPPKDFNKTLADRIMEIPEIVDGAKVSRALVVELMSPFGKTRSVDKALRTLLDSEHLVQVGKGQYQKAGE